jgi:hypothetical protein
MPEMELTHEQRQHFFDQGYVHIPSVVPRERVHAAVRAINSSLGSNGIDPAKLTTFRARSYCPELQSAPEITGLLNDTPVLEVAESMIGRGQVKPATSGQIALRFPSMAPASPPHPHLDGMYTPTNGVPEGKIMNFTALVGILLSDLPTGDAGNLAVWPGTHHIYEQYFREHGPQSLLTGMPPVELPEPVQITGSAGDAVICHYQLAHGITGNASPLIRYAIYFRLSHIDHEALRWESMTDIWREWEAFQDLKSV